MLIFDFRAIGNKLLENRKKIGLTQNEVAEKANLSDRTYADIERGCVNMRIETFLKICEVLCVTPDEILTNENRISEITMAELVQKLNQCTFSQQETAIKLLNVYLDSLR